MHPATSILIVACLFAIVPVAVAGDGADAASADCLVVSALPPTASVGFGCTCLLFPTAVYC